MDGTLDLYIYVEIDLQVSKRNSINSLNSLTGQKWKNSNHSFTLIDLWSCFSQFQQKVKRYIWVKSCTYMLHGRASNNKLKRKHSCRMRTAHFCGSRGTGGRSKVLGVYDPRSMVPGVWSQERYGPRDCPREVWFQGVQSEVGDTNPLTPFSCV